MPGLDHDVHPSTVGSKQYDACQKKQRKSGYWAPDICHKMNPPERVWTWVEDTSSVECRYDKSLTDFKCNGCPRTGQGVPNDQRIRRVGT